MLFSLHDFEAILEQVRFRDWRLLVREEPMGQGTFLQWEFDAACTDTGEPALQRGRKWRLSAHMTRSEVVQTALAGALAAVEHEAREAFLYRGCAVFGPHLDVDALVDARTEVRA